MAMQPSQLSQPACRDLVDQNVRSRFQHLGRSERRSRKALYCCPSACYRDEDRSTARLSKASVDSILGIGRHRRACKRPITSRRSNLSAWTPYNDDNIILRQGTSRRDSFW
ncbi:uncharacterized protein MEPE_00814 [Melanopsichium pennsylvanicum]|uniref:Uncharacterized protein n=1 Tax=Melanopsichium pennsylvanicum TaxID=63383 RepID=A0AAJ5C323_9BASI|nr:uncharacterized protein MEPE_00814 [Melanopsichium pennsylvanicum]